MRGLGVVILLYHRVGSFACDPHALAVEPERYADQLEWLSRNVDVVSLADHPRRAGRKVIITFDDGYADNAGIAREVLQATGLPATFFITAGRLGSRSEFWWDRLEQMLLHPGPERAYVSVDIGGRRLWVDTREGASRERAYWALFWRLRLIRPTDITEVLDEVAAQLGVRPCDRDTHRMMTAEELLTIARSEQFEIGSHTLTHPLLAALAEADQREEIAGSRAFLQRLIDGSILSFAYPYGGMETINNVTTRLVSEAGYERACIVGESSSTSQLPELRLPRRVVGDWDREIFAQHVNLWLES